MRIAIGADHGGFELKEHLKRWLASKGHELDDCGAYDVNPVDYPVIAEAVARKVSRGESARGIVIDGAGIGSSMAANKVPGVRAALCYDVSSARNSREHNDANVLTLGARLIGVGLAEQIAETFVATECSEERHKRRVAMIGEIEARERERAASCAVPAKEPACAPCAAKALADKPPSADSTPPDGKSLAFRASASQWLASLHPPRGASSSEMASTPKLDDLSADDLARVADRIASMLGGGATRRGELICFGDVCLDAAAAKQWIGFGVGRLSSSLGGWAGQGGLGDVARYIDHTLLRPDATAEQIRQLCDEARANKFMSVCVNPCWVKRCHELLRGSVSSSSPGGSSQGVLVCTVIGFPLGANVGDVKAMEARRAIRDGAGEIDMVINVGALKSGDDELVFRDIRAVVDAAEDGRALCKVIIETALLDDEEKVRACVLAKKARADFVKTSTGFASGGATAADVALMHRAVGGELGVKASGGVKSFADLEDMVKAGATRIGASAGIKILKEAAGQAGGAAPAGKY